MVVKLFFSTRIEITSPRCVLTWHLIQASFWGGVKGANSGLSPPIFGVENLGCICDPGLPPFKLGLDENFGGAYGSCEDMSPWTLGGVENFGWPRRFWPGLSPPTFGVEGAFVAVVATWTVRALRRPPETLRLPTFISPFRVTSFVVKRCSVRWIV